MRCLLLVAQQVIKVKIPPGSWILKRRDEKGADLDSPTAATHLTAITSPLTARDLCTTVPFFFFPKKMLGF